MKQLKLSKTLFNQLIAITLLLTTSAWVSPSLPICNNGMSCSTNQKSAETTAKKATLLYFFTSYILCPDISLCSSLTSFLAFLISSLFFYFTSSLTPTRAEASS